MSSCHPLSGLFVVEIGHSIAAPYAGMILAELGAEVVKIENPGRGDPGASGGRALAGGRASGTFVGLRSLPFGWAGDRTTMQSPSPPGGAPLGSQWLRR